MKTKKNKWMSWVWCLLLAAATVRADVPRVIYDTDLGASMCDLTALDMAVQLDELGTLKLIGVVLDRPDYSDPAKKGRFLEFTARALASMNRNDIPLGRSMPLLNPDGTDRVADVYTPYWEMVDRTDEEDGSPLLPTVPEKRLHALPDAVGLYRRLLHDSDDHSVTICAVGFLNNLVALMKSEANRDGDDIPMSGMELIREKVKELWVMAGCFNNGGIAQDGHGEYNVWNDVASAKYVFEKWPGEIIFSPWEVGLQLEYKAEWQAQDFPKGCRRPVMYHNQRIWGNPPPEVDPFPNRLWDNAAFLNDSIGPGALPLSGRGRVTVRDDGSGITDFTPAADGNCRYQDAERIDVDATLPRIRGICTADPAKKIPRVIVDTDLGSSLDDLAVLALAAHGHWNGDINLVGMMVDRPDGSNPTGDPNGRGEFLRFADAYMTTLGLRDVPIGAPVKPLSEVQVFKPYWTIIHSNDTVTGQALLRGSGRALEEFPDAVALYRRLLDESPDHSVDICQTGFFGNLVALMESKANHQGDGIPKSGLELIREKVRTLRVMAGCFEGDGIAEDGHGEYNVWGDIGSAQRVFNEWPGPIVCSPWEVGLKLRYEPDAMRNDFPYGGRDKALYAFARYWGEPAPNDEFANRLWDAMTVLGLLREDCARLSPCGSIAVEDKTGITRFTPRADGRCRYQYLTSEADARSLVETIREILSDGRFSPIRTEQDVGTTGK